jgi:hypothetical protein
VAEQDFQAQNNFADSLMCSDLIFFSGELKAVEILSQQQQQHGPITKKVCNTIKIGFKWSSPGSGE